MLTRNFRNLIGSMLQSTTIVKGTLPVTDVYGMQGFTTGQFGQFPYGRTIGYTADRYAAGITLGTGTTQPTLEDFNLESPVSSTDVNVTFTAHSIAVDEGNPYIQFNMTATNMSSREITLTEVCYKQGVTRTTVHGGTAAENVVVMLDRTMLTPSITLQPEEATVIVYRLRTDSYSDTTVNGVKVVSWQFGSDEDVADMIDAAQAGTIDLRECGWQVGNMRPVEISSFTSGGVTNAAQTIDLVITSFDDYNECGCVMQVDFLEALESPIRMDTADTNVGGYGLSEMYTTTLPALLSAMPEWLSSRAVEFSALTSEGGNSATIQSVTGNRLCLRSEFELRNTVGGSKAGEGAMVPWYQTAQKMRQKRRGRVGGANTYWFRSPAGNSTQYVTVSRGDASQFGNVNASAANGVAPFMCL